jgi:phosphorylcholine metabolism protein LicD
MLIILQWIPIDFFTLGYHPKAAITVKKAAYRHRQLIRFDNKMIKRPHYDTGVRGKSIKKVLYSQKA